MDATKTATLLRKAKTALATLRGEKQALEAQLEEARPKLAKLDELEKQQARRQQAEEVAQIMVDSRQLAPEARYDKVAELMEQDDLPTIKRAVEMIRDGEDLDKVGELAGAGSVDASGQFWQDFLGSIDD